MAKFFKLENELINLENVFRVLKSSDDAIVIQHSMVERDYISYSFDSLEIRDDVFSQLCELVGVKDEV